MCAPQVPTLPVANVDRVVLLLDSAFWLDIQQLSPGNTPFQQQAAEGLGLFNATLNLDPSCLTAYG